MRDLKMLSVATIWITLGCAGAAQGTTPAADAALGEAQRWVGRALFLRGFPAANELRYDAAGRTDGTGKTVDWTLAGMDVQTVQRKDGGAIELDGVRVAIRYNDGNHFFERHAQKDERVKVVIATTAGETAGDFEKAMGAVFAVGIDPAMQRAMPGFWRHFFDPRLTWGQDEIGAATVYGLAADVTPAAVVKKADAGYTPEGQHDRVQGKVGLRMVVDATGAVRRVAISHPLGYGLDARAAEAMARWRFTAAQRGGAAVAQGVELSEEFVLVPGRF